MQTILRINSKLIVTKLLDIQLFSLKQTKSSIVEYVAKMKWNFFLRLHILKEYLKIVVSLIDRYNYEPKGFSNGYFTSPKLIC